MGMGMGMGMGMEMGMGALVAALAALRCVDAGGYSPVLMGVPVSRTSKSAPVTLPKSVSSSPT
jgi:hypothetical protein